MQHCCGILVFVIIAIAGISQCATAGERPNFLLIIADDLCWRDMGWTGNNQVRTPHLDQLATEGLSTTTMFTPATTCSPSRHALYTGLFCVRSGAYPNHTHTFDGTKSIFTHLKDWIPGRATEQIARRPASIVSVRTYSECGRPDGN